MATVVSNARKVATGEHIRFQRFAWCVLVWNVLVVLWGAYVRASGSGAGCGSHWPTCNGDVIPHSPQAATIIEYTHRLMSGVALFAVVALCIWAFRTFPYRSRVRRAAGTSVFFLVLEALLGAGLVVFDYVAGNASVGRAMYLSAHLVNTLLLLAALTLTAWYARIEQHGFLPSPYPTLATATLPLAVLVAITGGIAALGDTLFPPTSLAAGIRQDFTPGSHFLLQLRIFHPAAAVVCAVYFLVVAVWVLKASTVRVTRAVSAAVIVLVSLQIAVGAVNIALLAPVWIQIVHLLFADLVWISLVILSAQATASARSVPS